MCILIGFGGKLPHGDPERTILFETAALNSVEGSEVSINTRRAPEQGFDSAENTPLRKFNFHRKKWKYKMISCIPTNPYPARILLCYIGYTTFYNYNCGTATMSQYGWHLCYRRILFSTCTALWMTPICTAESVQCTHGNEKSRLKSQVQFLFRAHVNNARTHRSAVCNSDNTKLKVMVSLQHCRRNSCW